MPNLVPVDVDPFGVQLHPVDFDPFGPEPTPPDRTPQRFQGPPSPAAANAVGSVIEGMISHAALPGRLAAGVQPQQPGMWSDEDQARLQMLESQAQKWGPEQALNMIGGGVPRAEPGALGAAGGGIKAYHGSPYDFDKFDISKIGTGEGAQAYGHGLYFAEHPQTAEAYRETLGNRRGDVSYANNLLSRTDGDIDKAIELAQSPQFMTTGEGRMFGPEAINYLQRMKSGLPPERVGKMYEVSINADPEHFLDWDKPLSEQHPQVREAIQKLPGFNPELADYTLGKNVEAIAGNTPAEATAALREAGIPGIRYLDQGSRNAGQVSMTTKYRAANLTNSNDTSERFFAARFNENGGDLDKTITALERDLEAHPNDKTIQKTLELARNPEAKFDLNTAAQTHNYVVFHDSPDFLQIMRKFGLAGLIGGGAAHFTTTPVDHDPFL